MSQSHRDYSQYPQIWSPTDVNPPLFVVQVPATIAVLEWPIYLSLMAQRVQWMIGQSVEVFGQAETNGCLIAAMNTIDSVQNCPSLQQSEGEWAREWAEILIHQTPAFSENEDLGWDWFPAPVISPTALNYPELKLIHDGIPLREWLDTLKVPYR